MRSCMVTSYFSHYTHSLSDGLPTLLQWHIALLFIQGMWACVTLSGGKKCCMHFFKLKLDCISRKMTSRLLSFFDSVQYFENLLCVTVCWPSAALGSADVLGCGCQSVSWSPGCISALQNDARVVSPPSERAGNPSETREAGSRAGVVVLTADSF